MNKNTILLKLLEKLIDDNNRKDFIISLYPEIEQCNLSSSGSLSDGTIYLDITTQNNRFKIEIKQIQNSVQFEINSDQNIFHYSSNSTHSCDPKIANITIAAILGEEYAKDVATEIIEECHNLNVKDREQSHLLTTKENETIETTIKNRNNDCLKYVNQILTIGGVNSTQTTNIINDATLKLNAHNGYFGLPGMSNPLDPYQPT